MVKNNFTRRIAEGGLLVSLASMFYLIGSYIPVLDILRYISVTPVVIGIMKYGMKQGLEITIASSLLAGILFSPISGADFFLSIGLIGLSLGFCIKENFGAFKTILYTFLAALTGFSISLMLYVLIMGTEIITKDFKAASEWLSSMLTWAITGGLINLNLPPDWIKPEWLTGVLMELLPSLLVFLAFYYVVYLWIFNLFIMKKLNIALPSNALIGEIPIFLIIPSWSLVFMLAGFICLVLSFYTNIRIFEITGLNLIMIMFILCFSKGVFSINIFVRNIIPANKNFRMITGFIVTILEFTLLFPLVLLWGIISIAFGLQNLALHEFLGNTYLKNGKFELAIKHYKKSLELNPRRTWTHQMLSLAYQKEGKNDLALMHYKKAIELGGRAGVSKI
jgi:hypothetical protein